MIPKIKLEHSDERGVIYSFQIEGKERLLTFTKAGHKRGGHFHKEIQQTLVLNGSIRWWEWRYDHEEVFDLNEGDKQTTPSFCSHLMEAVTDCWILETKTDSDSSQNEIIAETYRKSIKGDHNDYLIRTFSKGINPNNQWTGKPEVLK